MAVPRRVSKLIALSVIGALFWSGSQVAQAADSVFDQPGATKQTSSAQGTVGTTKFTAFRVRLMAGDRIGRYSKGLFCSGGSDVAFDPSKQIAPFMNLAKLAFKQEMETARLPLFYGNDSAFDTSTSADSDYHLGGTLTLVDFDLCGEPSDRKGHFRVRVIWELFSVRLQKVVYRAETDGQAGAESAMDDRRGQIGRDAFADSLRRVLHNPSFEAEIKADHSSDPVVAAPGKAVLKLIPGSLSLPGGTAKNVASLRAATVSIRNGTATGSGFYVSDGYLLTNHHVVNTAHYVKVKLADGKELTGEVIRQNVLRDVALVKTESAGVEPLSVRASPAVDGEDVYVIGSPMGSDLAGTLTKGVLSGLRERGGLHYLQSDAAVNPGNSGGPLLDGEGAVIGITVQKRMDAAGLGFFIPIDEALSTLALGFESMDDGGGKGVSSALAPDVKHRTKTP